MDHPLAKVNSESMETTDSAKVHSSEPPVTPPNSQQSLGMDQPLATTSFEITDTVIPAKKMRLSEPPAIPSTSGTQLAITSVDQSLATASSEIADNIIPAKKVLRPVPPAIPLIFGTRRASSSVDHQVTTATSGITDITIPGKTVRPPVPPAIPSTSGTQHKRTSSSVDHQVTTATSGITDTTIPGKTVRPPVPPAIPSTSGTQHKRTSSSVDHPLATTLSSTDTAIPAKKVCPSDPPVTPEIAKVLLECLKKPKLKYLPTIPPPKPPRPIVDEKKDDVTAPKQKTKLQVNKKTMNVKKAERFEKYKKRHTQLLGTVFGEMREKPKRAKPKQAKLQQATPKQATPKSVVKKGIDKKLNCDPAKEGGVKLKPRFDPIEWDKDDEEEADLLIEQMKQCKIVHNKPASMPHDAAPRQLSLKKGSLGKQKIECTETASPDKEENKTPETSVSEMLQNQKDSMFLIQFPPCLPGHVIDEKQPPKPGTSKQGSKMATRPCRLDDLSPGQIGHLEFMASGKARLNFDNGNMMYLTAGSPIRRRMEAVSVETIPVQKCGSMKVLGKIASRFMCNPDLEAELEKVREKQSK